MVARGSRFHGRGLHLSLLPGRDRRWQDRTDRGLHASLQLAGQSRGPLTESFPRRDLRVSLYHFSSFVQFKKAAEEKQPEDTRVIDTFHFNGHKKKSEPDFKEKKTGDFFT